MVKNGGKGKMKLRIKKYYLFEEFPFYSIEKLIIEDKKEHWLKVLDLVDDDLSLARKLKRFLEKQKI